MLTLLNKTSKYQKKITGWTYAILAPIGNAATIFFGSTSLDTNPYYQKLAWGRRAIDIPLTSSEFLATIFSRSCAIHHEYENQANQSWQVWWEETKNNFNPHNWTHGKIGRAAVWLCSWSVLVNVLVSTFNSFLIINWFTTHEMANFTISFIAALSVSVSFDIFIGRKVLSHLDEWSDTTRIAHDTPKGKIALATALIISTSLGQGLFTLLATTRGLFLLNRLFFSNFLSNAAVLTGGVFSAALTVGTTFLSRGLSIWQRMLQPDHSPQRAYQEVVDNHEQTKCCYSMIITSLYWFTNIGNAFANGLKTTAGGEDFLDYRQWPSSELARLLISAITLGGGMVYSSLSLSGNDIKNNIHRFFKSAPVEPPQEPLSINRSESITSPISPRRGSLLDNV